MDIASLVKNAKLAPQSYGIAMAQCRFGGPEGIWLECTCCNASEVIIGSRPGGVEGLAWSTVSNGDAASVFRRHGWTGRGDRLLKAKCPACSLAESSK